MTTEPDDAERRHAATFARLRARHQRQLGNETATRARSAALVRRLVSDGIRPDRKRPKPDAVYRALMQQGLRRGQIPLPPLPSDSDDST